MFDLDGVLVESEQLWDAARRRVVQEHGGRWSAQAGTDMLGMSAPEWSRYLVARLGVQLTPGQVNAAVLGEVEDHYRRSLPLMPGAVDAVRVIARGWPLGLASSSNAEIIELFLDLSGLREQFTAWVSSEQVAHGKPAPDVYLETARRVGVEPAACVAVEDSSNGLRSASAAGMAVVAVPNATFPPAPDALALAVMTIGTVRELTPQVIRRAAHHGLIAPARTGGPAAHGEGDRGRGGSW